MAELSRAERFDRLDESIKNGQVSKTMVGPNSLLGILDPRIVDDLDGWVNKYAVLESLMPCWFGLLTTDLTEHVSDEYRTGFLLRYSKALREADVLTKCEWLAIEREIRVFILKEALNLGMVDSKIQDLSNRVVNHQYHDDAYHGWSRLSEEARAIKSYFRSGSRDHVMAHLIERLCGSLFFGLLADVFESLWGPYWKINHVGWEALADMTLSTLEEYCQQVWE